MARMSEWAKAVVEAYHSRGYSTVQISRILAAQHAIKLSRFGVLKYLKRVENPKIRKKIGGKVKDFHNKFFAAVASGIYSSRLSNQYTKY